MKDRIVRTATIIILSLLLGIPGMQAQQVWPGDVNNNGIVNNIDILYWSIADGATGPARPSVSSNWEAEEIDSLWSQSFPDGLNYAFADCNGNGVINESDLNVILQNYWLVQDGGIIIPDDYFLGEASVDPSLLLEAEDPITEPGAEENLLLSLGAEGDSIQNFKGIAFSITYDPDELVNPPGVGNDVLEFQFANDSWIDGQGAGMGRDFLFIDEESGVAQVALYRRNSEDPVTGAGSVGRFSIVVEEVVFGVVQLDTDSIRLIDNGLNSTKVAPSSALLAEDSVLLNTGQEFLPDSEVRAYPNPTTGRVTVDMEGHHLEIRTIEVYDSRGQLLRQLRASRPAAQAQITMGNLPDGLYLLKIKTNKGIATKTVAKMPGR